MATPESSNVSQLVAAEVTAQLAPTVMALRLVASNATAQAAEIVALRANVSTQAAEIVALRAMVAVLEREAGRSLLGGDAYNTTAFFVAILVAFYQLIPDPTGNQDASDLSELVVYHQWRRAAVALFLYGLMVLIVAVHQLQAGWRGIDLAWLLALMLAPWAPVAKQVRLTLAGFWRVPAMMRSRGCRNRLTAVMREYLRVGNLHLVPTLIARERLSVVLLPPLRVPRWVLPSDVANKDDVIKNVMSQVMQHSPVMVDADDVRGAPVSDRCIDSYPLTRRLNFLGLFVRMLSCRADTVRTTWSPDRAFPFCLVRYCRRARRFCSRHAVGKKKVLSPFKWFSSDTAEDTARADAGVEVDVEHGHYKRRMLKTWEESALLDAIDAVIPGGTLSKARVKLLDDEFCDRCMMVFRASVELFAESSIYGHDGVSTAEWFKYFDVQATGSLIYALITLRAAVLVDCGATPVSDGSAGGIDAEDGQTTTLVTDQVLVLFFLVARSLLGGSERLDKLGDHISGRYHSAHWWNRYWEDLQRVLGRPVDVGSPSPWTDSKAMGRSMRSAARSTTVAEVRDLLQAAYETGPQSDSPAANTATPGGANSGTRICSVDGCLLAMQEDLRTPLIRQRRRPNQTGAHGAVAADMGELQPPSAASSVAQSASSSPPPPPRQPRPPLSSPEEGPPPPVGNGRRLSRGL